MLRSEQVAPDFELPTLEGRRVRRSDYRHRHRNLALVFLPPAPEQVWVGLLDELSALQPRLREENAEVLAIFPGSIPAAVGFAAALRLPFPVAVDETGDAARAYGAEEGAVVVLDQFGAPLEAWRPPLLPSAEEVAAAAQLSELACPECGVTHWPAAEV